MEKEGGSLRSLYAASAQMPSARMILLMRAHFVSRFYLQGFTDPDTPPRQEPYLWVYSIKHASWRRRAPINVAHTSNYYEQPPVPGQPDDWLEKFLSRMETFAARVVRGRLTKKEDLSDHDRTVFAFFMALMVLRVPVYHGRISAMLSRL
ncbi:MAG: DUF4238 domain-containing protein, partial [Planctomycetota bacterium]